ncbi:hypothetical protein CVT24_008076 [Panaeolus cyanescens]|uniref:Chromatin-remodeling ATPase INO80 n=1 Tax=Panaeolus cyanescens TaxID=181874 RepID=A0A409W0I4_9AGAR|nr:hypothetical protein CVT24_008076 [Panaeolus cyanescens]
MSLSRILNDDPPESHSSYLRQSQPLATDHHLQDHLDDLAHSPNSPHTSYSILHEDQQPPRPHYRTNTRQQQPWDSQAADWSPEPQEQRAVDSLPAPYEHDKHPPPSSEVEQPAQEDTHDVISKKRRKASDRPATDQQATKTRRASQRKSQKKERETRPPSPASETVSAKPARQPSPDAHLDGSDLDDCPELWSVDLNQYKLDTQKRYSHLTHCFWSNVSDRNASTAQSLSHYYSTKIDSFPTLPPSPPLPSLPIDDEFESMTASGPRNNGQVQAQRRFDASAEDAAFEFERAMLHDSPAPKEKKDTRKRPIPSASSDVEAVDDAAAPEELAPPAPKKRKTDSAARSISTNDPESHPSHDSVKLTVPKLKVKGKQANKEREPSHDSVSATPKAKKKPGPKKKGLAAELDSEHPSRPSSVLGDVTPAVSRPNSPVPANTTMVYELDEYVPPMKRAKKVDDGALVKRIKTLEESQRKVWTNIARRDVAKVYKYQSLGYQARQAQLERIAKLASIQSRKPFTKTAKANKDVQTKAKRLMREMQVFWKKNEKEERDVRKREHKEAMDRLKVEEEKREAARQARKLEFLISQTELYSHFVGSKLKTATEIEGDSEALPLPAGANLEDVDPDALPELDFENEDHTNIHLIARHNAQQAISLAKQRAQQFDAQTALERKTNEALELAKAQAHIHEDIGETQTKAPLVDLDSDELNFQNPTSLSGPLTIGQPRMLMAQLKEYQLKGLNWLATLYEQGINGILADEMGLGKTVQSISLLAYLAETHDIWGPFLVVAPASTLHNWQQEITRFVPRLKALPYWGNVKDRTTLRKFWSKKEISYNQEAPFHVLITSYQLVTQDQQYFQRVKWQYMILDEAQNIKNSSSVRWKTLLGFHCRNRLLLTGTPIQNSMQELWALLHFIMPSLFDSHDEFNEWFSKDIENAAENKGSKLNEHQLRRLHMILKPFMLRRVKRHVQNELSEKIEIDIYVDMSARQRSLYAALLSNVSVADLLEKAANIGDADSARSLMNLVMQFRKVCNHPELFERADVTAPFAFCKFGRSGAINREGDFVILPYSTTNPIQYNIPSLLYQDGGMLDVPLEHSNSPRRSSCVSKLFNIWSTDWIHRSVYDCNDNGFSFLRFSCFTPSEVHRIHASTLFDRVRLVHEKEVLVHDPSLASDPDFAIHCISNTYKITPHNLQSLPGTGVLHTLQTSSHRQWQHSCLSRPSMKWYSPSSVAPPITPYCIDRAFIESLNSAAEAPVEALALYGLPIHLRDSPQACSIYHDLLPGASPSGLCNTSPSDQLPMSFMQIPEAKRLIYDSAKLSRLDSLLQELKAGDHRVLVYFQMTRMMDLMEEYLIYRQYKYLRLDGSSKLEDRRDMVIDWQTKPEIFIFLLSTRAGGLGINLTAADTVVFYDHDWNPSNDAQAMDRAHRLGQTRQVTVYRLITKGTIDERIVQLARVKKDVQDIVVGNKNFTDVTKPSEIVQLLLNDEQLASLESSSRLSGGKGASSGKQAGDSVPDLWNEEGDDFFGHTAVAAPEKPEDVEGHANAAGVRGKKRKAGGTGAPRGRKPGSKKKQPAPVEID